MPDTADNKNDVMKLILGVKDRLAGFGVTSIGLFGSFARDEQTPTSDVDILVDFAPDRHSFDNFMDVAFLLEEILGRRVEIVTREALSPYIGPHILKEVQSVSIAA